MNLDHPIRSRGGGTHQPALLADSAPLLLSLLLLSLLLFSPPAFSAESESAWLLDVKSKIALTSGEQKLTISAKGLEISAKGFDIQIEGDAGRILLVYHTKKEYCESTVDEFTKRYATREAYKSTNVGSLKPQTLKKEVITGKTGKIYNLPVTQYLVTVKDQGKVFLLKEFWATDAIKAPPKFVDAWAKITGVPTGHGFPLRVIRNTKTGKRVELDTLRAVNGKLPADAFKGVTGYKKVKNEITLLMHLESADSIEDMLLPK
jgi:ribosomal protein L21E